MLDGMTNIKASEVLKELKLYTEDLPHYSPDEVAEALEMAIKALEQQPCEDCISREALMQKLNAWDGKAHGIPNYAWKVIRELPPVTPERPKGKWIKYKVDIAPHPLHCSLCGFSNHHISDRYIKEFRRCPNCGSYNGGNDNGDE